MTIRSILILVGATALLNYPASQATEETSQQKQQPKTYEKCVMSASERKNKWAQYREDVNKCRAEFDVPGKY